MSDEPPRTSRSSRFAEAWHRLIHPRFAEERERFQDMARALRKNTAEQREQLLGVRAMLDAMRAHMDAQARQKDVRGVELALRQVEAAVGRQYRMTGKALRFAEWQEEQRVVERRLRRRVQRFGSGDVPVLIGPWSGEVGFELLYWIPFVTWVVQQASVAPDRIVVVSRGGASPWYSHLGGRYIDVLSHFTPEEFRVQTEVQKKQKRLGPFDRQVVRRAIADAGITRAHLLHPGLMYPLFRPFWKQDDAVSRVEEYTANRLLEKRQLRDLTRRLPSDYVAVRFYFSACFPDTPSNRGFVESVVARLTESTDVVLLNTGINVDDHRDYSPQSARQSRIHSVQDLMTPDRNLDVQTAVIAGARAFVGTYGGFSYLAPLYGVKSLAFYSDHTAFYAHHLDFAQRTFRRISAASLVPLDVRDVDLVRMALTPREEIAKA